MICSNLHVYNMSRRQKGPGLLACYRGRVSSLFEVLVGNGQLLVIKKETTKFVVSFLHIN